MFTVSTARIVLGAILFLSFAFKIRAFRKFVRAVAAYHILPDSLVVCFSVGIVALEGVSAALLLLNWQTTKAAGIALALLVLFTVAIAANLIRGRVNLNCGCGLFGRRLGPHLILRNFGLSGLAILAMVPSISASFRTVSWLLCMAFTCMIVVAGALGAAQKPTSPITSKDQAIA